MTYNNEARHYFKLKNGIIKSCPHTISYTQGLKGLFRGFFMGHKARRSSFSTPVIYYDHSAQHQALKLVHPHQHHSRWFTAGISIVGLSLAWWLSQSNASYDDTKVPEYRISGFDASSAVVPAIIQSTMSSSDSHERLQQKNEPAQQDLLDSATSPQVLASSPVLTTPIVQPLKASAVSIPVVDSSTTPVSIPSAISQSSPEISTTWQVLTVQKGDTLSKLFSRHNIRRADLYRLLKLKAHKRTLTRLRPGQNIQVKVTPEGDLLGFQTKLNYRQDLLIEVAENDIGFSAQIQERELETRILSKAGDIQHSLFVDAREAGISSKKIKEMMKIFNWDIDFSQDLHKGDTFSLVYESLYCDGEHVKDEAILAAEFVNRGLSYQIVRYTDPSGYTAYYDPDGHSLQKAFIRNPVKIGQITSGFSLKRHHPVLNKIRAHKGVDYGAPAGTAIYAAGNGKVAFVGRKNGYGNTVILEHGDKYSTLYAHMSGFAKDLSLGQKVKQEQVIGYVGQTGLASGPHLHYEFRIDGEHKNPLTVKLPKATPIAAEYKQDFLAKTQVLMTALRASATQVALVKE